MRKDAYVDAFGGADEAVEIAAEGALPPTVAAAMADVDLGDAALAGEAQDGIDRIFAIEFGDFRAFGRAKRLHPLARNGAVRETTRGD